jgi:hypothetical protein
VRRLVTRRAVSRRATRDMRVAAAAWAAVAEAAKQKRVALRWAVARVRVAGLGLGL